MRSSDAGSSEEGAFTSCTLWLINNYILLGRVEQAREALDYLLSFRNDLGLYSEEIDPETREQLGNFPQALTHVAVISTIRHQNGRRAKISTGVDTFKTAWSGQRSKKVPRRIERPAAP